MTVPGERISAAIAGWLCGCLLLLPVAGAAAEGERTHARRVVQHYPVPDAILTDPNGKSYSLAQELEAEGPVVLSFISTRCGEACAGTRRLLAELQRQSKLRILSVAYEPHHDTRARLRAYAKETGAGPGWMLLTGFSRQIDPLLQAFGTDPATASRWLFVHPSPKAAWVRFEGPVSSADVLNELD